MLADSCTDASRGEASPAPASGCSAGTLALALPYTEACEEYIRELWVAYDEAADAFPQLRTPGQQWQPILWQARGLVPHRSLAFKPTAADAPDVIVVLELCVDRGETTFFPRFSVQGSASVQLACTRTPHFQPVTTDLRRLAQAAVLVFRRFRKYGLVGGSCHDYVFELGSTLGVDPLHDLQPQADKITEEFEDRTQPTKLRLAGLISLRIAATVTGCTLAIAAVDAVVTAGAVGQFSRMLYRRLRADHVPEGECMGKTEVVKSSIACMLGGIESTETDGSSSTSTIATDAHGWASTGGSCEGEACATVGPSSPSGALHCGGGRCRVRCYAVPAP